MISTRARAYVRARATREMSYTVRVERVSLPSYATDSLVGTPGSKEILYEGPCRIWEITGASTVVIGETDIDMQSVQASFPWDSELFHKNDEILVLAALTDSAMIGKRLQIQSSAKAGELRATRRYSVSVVN